MHSTILVAGGSGRIGREVCRIACTMGHKVISVSHKGRPTLHEAWAQDVQWISSTIFQPGRWNDCMIGCDAVIGCVGVQKERKSEGITFQRLNYESTAILAVSAKKAGVDKFVYISGAKRPFFTPAGYLESKRRSEQTLKASGFSLAILRPSTVYDTRRPGAEVLWTLMKLLTSLPAIGGKLQEFKPLTVEQVATACVLAAVDPSIKGNLDPQGIAVLAATV